MAKPDYDLVVIGAGSGGVRAARIAALHGARVLVAEEYRVGGTCVIRGCVPKKLFVYASRFADEFEDAAGFGWMLEGARFEWPTLVSNKDREIDRLEGAYVDTLRAAGAELVRSRAEVEDAHTVRLIATGERVRAGTILIATGARPYRDESIAGVDLAITSDEAFHLPSLPRRLVLVGAGYIAVEFGSLFDLLGVEVTVVQRGIGILRGFDEDLRAGLREAMERRGIRFLFGEMPAALSKTSKGLRLTTRAGRTIETDCVMLATGRLPNTGGLGLEAAGVALSPGGAVVVDEWSRSSVPSIYAVGDVTDRVNLTPVAIREGHAFADTVFGGRPTPVDHRLIPTAVFATPELGTVGLTEVAARANCRSVDIYRSSFRPLKATLSGRNERTLMKIVVDGETDRVLGVHILGEGAAEMAQILTIPLRMGATKKQFDAAMALHPTSAEELVTMRTRSASYVKEVAD